jgi:hypothetical protein
MFFPQKEELTEQTFKLLGFFHFDKLKRLRKKKEISVLSNKSWSSGLAFAMMVMFKVQAGKGMTLVCVMLR